MPDEDGRAPERGAPDDDERDEGELAPAREFPVPELERELEPGRELEPERGLDAERTPEREVPDEEEVERAPAREFPELEPERGLEAERVLPPDDEPLLGADLGRVGRGIMLAFDEKRFFCKGTLLKCGKLFVVSVRNGLQALGQPAHIALFRIRHGICCFRRR